MASSQNPQPVLLCIAGSDPCAGAGIQADIKTASALGVYALTAVTALTVQNSLGLQRVEAVPCSLLRAQIEALLEDHRIAAVKVGMLANANQARLLADLQRNQLAGLPWIVDTPLSASAGGALLEGELNEHYWSLLSGAELITPNLNEAAQLTGQPVAGSDEAMLTQAQLLLASGLAAVLLKGGHRADQAADVLLVREQPPCWFKAPLITTRNHHGTGCTLASAIAAYRVRGLSLAAAIGRAIDYQRACIAHSAHYAIGDLQAGTGPLWHFADPLISPEKHRE